MKVVIDQISKAKGEPWGSNFYVRWDNKKPRENQEETLMQKISYIKEGYTHEKFVKAQEEIQQRLKAAIDAKVAEETKKIEK